MTIPAPPDSIVRPAHHTAPTTPPWVRITIRPAPLPEPDYASVGKLPHGTLVLIDGFLANATRLGRLVASVVDDSAAGAVALAYPIRRKAVIVWSRLPTLTAGQSIPLPASLL